jgi:hypothetical protein
MSTFRLGINMAGAVSAGAYTAGVLDFLIEALDAWYDARKNGGVPMHEVSLDVFSGASAGGMCAAIASALVQGEFEHVHYGAKPDQTSNLLYQSWVNDIDIRKLLETNDLVDGQPVYSLLDCSIIDHIADNAIKPGPPTNRTYISPSLTLFLTLTNLTGIPYSLSDEGGSAEESTLYHADWLRFETILAGGKPIGATAKPLPVGKPGEAAWPLLKEAAKATGAFPIFLKARQLPRDRSEYDIPRWQSINPDANKGQAAVTPAWPPDMASTIQTVNVDGGVIDNDPFDLAHDYLATLEPRPKSELANQNPRGAEEADRAVVTVSPFPVQIQFKQDATLQKDGTVTQVVGNMLPLFITQSRFFGESLALITKGTSSRFVIAPSDATRPAQHALQGASLGAFGGFFERSFRQHDFQLGRRNCQQFLRRYFALPVDNPVIASGLSPEARRNFRIPPPPDAPPSKETDWIPIIPLCGTLRENEERSPERKQISDESLTEIVDLIDSRLNRLLTHLLPTEIGSAVALAARAAELFGKHRIKEMLTEQFRKAEAN